MPNATPVLHIPSMSATIRLFTFDDLPAMVNIYNGYHRAVDDKTATTAEHMTISLQHLVNCDPFQDLFMVDVAEKTIGYGRIEWKDTQENERIYTFSTRILPEYATGDIEQGFMSLFVERAKAMSQANPTTNPEWMQTYTNIHPNTKLPDVLISLGYDKIRYSYKMIRDLTQPIQALPLPANIEVRPVLPDHYRAIWDADIESFRDHWGFREPADADYQAWINDPDRMPALWKVAWSGTEVVGMILNFVDQNFNTTFNVQRGYTEVIATRRPWRRQGIAAALLSQSLQMFTDMGMTEAALGVDAHNPHGALGVYQRAGFVVDMTSVWFRKALI